MTAPTRGNGWRDERDLVGELIRQAGPREPAGADRRARVRAAAHAAWQSGQRARTWRRRLLMAAAVAGISTAGALWWPRPAPAPAVARVELVGVVSRVEGQVTVAGLGAGADPAYAGVGTSVWTGAALTTPDDSRTVVALAGGGRLVLDAGTDLELLAPREMALSRGAIYFDDHGGEAISPVVVRTPSGAVTDIGTRFEVRVTGGAVVVRVRDGRVRLTGPAGEHDAGGGTELVVSTDFTVTTGAHEVFGRSWSWIESALSPTGNRHTLGELLDWVAREGGYTVGFDESVDGGPLRAIELLGPVQGLTVEEALAVMLPAAGLTYRIERGHVTLAGGGAPEGVLR